MALTEETIRALLVEYVGTDFGPAERARLLPLVEAYLERLRELRALDLGPADPQLFEGLYRVGGSDE
jgi:hypothetical protein